MAINLKPSEQLTIGALSATIVYSIFSLNTPNLADVRHDQPGNMNTYKSVNTATWTSAAVIGALALLAKSPTVWVFGGGMIIAETWKHHFANFGKSGAEENAAQWTGQNS